VRLRGLSHSHAGQRCHPAAGAGHRSARARSRRSHARCRRRSRPDWAQARSRATGRGLGRAQEVVIGGCLGVAHESNTRKARRDLLEHRQPLAGDARLVLHHAFVCRGRGRALPRACDSRRSMAAAYPQRSRAVIFPKERAGAAAGAFRADPLRATAPELIDPNG
jgi:hypothetical protein